MSTLSKQEQNRAAGVAFGAHALHDGYTDLIYVMLPIWQSEFGIGFAALGLVKTMYSGTLAGFQVPSSMLAERIGTPLVLAFGTALAGLGFCFAGFSAGFPLLMASLLIGGVGAATQHPLASALVTRAFPRDRALKAIGSYNFSGDIGKMIVPVSASLLLVVMNWRPALIVLGAVGVVAGIAIYMLTPRLQAVAPEPKVVKANGKAGLHSFGFPLLLSIGILDSATRMAFLTFLPFLLTAKGASVPTIGFALTLLFAGGAAGKLVCAFIGERIGVIATVWLTEIITAAGIIALLPLPLEAVLLLLPVVGVALNGTSSVLYGSVPSLVEPSKHSRAFGIFYTGTIGAGAVSPVLYGFVGDAFGVPTTLTVIALVVLLTLPLTLLLRPALAAIRAA